MIVACAVAVVWSTTFPKASSSPSNPAMISFIRVSADSLCTALTPKNLGYASRLTWSRHQGDQLNADARYRKQRHGAAVLRELGVRVQYSASQTTIPVRPSPSASQRSEPQKISACRSESEQQRLSRPGNANRIYNRHQHAAPEGDARDHGDTGDTTTESCEGAVRLQCLT